MIQVFTECYTYVCKKRSLTTTLCYMTAYNCWNRMRLESSRHPPKKIASDQGVIRMKVQTKCHNEWVTNKGSETLKTERLCCLQTGAPPPEIFSTFILSNFSPGYFKLKEASQCLNSGFRIKSKKINLYFFVDFLFVLFPHFVIILKWHKTKGAKRNKSTKM